MSQSVRELTIRLNGEVSAGAGRIANTLSNIGNLLEQVGGNARQFQEDSTNVYRSYEDEMLAAKYALSAQVESTSQLEKQMAGLEQAAQKWASTSIFHTNDVSKAINEAAHAGWDYQTILEGIPQAMLIAQAGGLDLSQGLDYLIKMMNATKTPVSDMGKMVDQWAMAANISATNIEEMGEAFMAMGSAAQFGDSTEELFSLLAVLANVGTTGSRAGTAVRSALMRLIAPTTKAEAAMEILGADIDEVNEALEDESVTKAAKKLKGLGFDAYTAEGKLKPVKQIFEELFELTQGMEEDERNEILSAIFPTRTIATALSLLAASNGELDKIFNKIANSEGYAQKGADIMMSGLTGSIETLKSKWEEFQRSIGETMAPMIENVSGWLGTFVDSLNSMSPETLSGITSMLTALSAVGPLMLGAAAIAKIAGTLGGIGTALLMAGLGASYLFGYLSKLEETNFKDNFGTLTADLTTLNNYVDSVKTKFDVEKEQITTWQAAVTEAQQSYEEALNSMNEGLLKKVLTGQTFTEDDFSEFQTLGQKMVQQTIAGINNAENADLSFLQAIFGDRSTPEETQAFTDAAAMLDWYYGSLSAEAESIGEGIRMKLTEALNNRELTAEDREGIQAQIDRLNQIQAEIAAGIREQDYYTQLNKAGRVSWDTINDYLSGNEEKLNENKASINDQYDRMSGIISAAYARARRTGGDITYTDSTGETVTIKASEASEAKEAETLAQVERERQAALAAEEEKFGTFASKAFETLMKDARFADAWEFARELSAGNFPVDEYGYIDFSQVKSLQGKSPEEIDALIDNLLAMDNADSGWFGLGTGRLTELLKPFAGYRSVQDMIDTLGKAFEYAGQLTAYANRQQYAEETGTEYEFITPNEEEITRAQEQLDSTERNLKRLQGSAQLKLGLDTTAVDNYVPKNKDATVFYHPFIYTGSGSQGGNDYLVDAVTYAEGGRATQASIFGEAGAEWAIPEEHSERTASLLNAARAASGFTWDDLISRYGNLNGSNNPVVLNYNPIINAGDATGVEAALKRDKESLYKMIRRALSEAKFMRSVEAYA